ncbi:MAG: hypothetical protein IKT41_04560 [Clostridia bacterium]|nr:hypothetical protein [Clostridia bacterium]
MNKYLDEFKYIFSKKEGQEGKKKNLENMVVFLIILIITIIIINSIIKEDENIINKEYNNTKLAEDIQNNNNTNKKENDISENLETILSHISGAGEVKVFLTYSETSEVIPVYNENINESTTEETDTSGGKRIINSKDNQKEVIYEELTEGKKIVTQKIISPKIEGAIITAKGAGNINVKNNIIQAVEAATGLAIHKIQVFEMR